MTISRRTRTLKWRSLGFIPEGWDDSRMIKYGDHGFLYLCRQLRDDWSSFEGYVIRDLKCRPGHGGYNVTNDWTGLDDALSKANADLGPPPISMSVKLRQLGPEEREAFGRASHQNWVAVKKQRLASDQAVPDDEPQAWDELPENEKEGFRRAAESLAQPEYLMWDAVTAMRNKMGERAFRKKLFELSVSFAVEKLGSHWSDAERYRVADFMVRLSEMLDVPAAIQANPSAVQYDAQA